MAPHSITPRPGPALMLLVTVAPGAAAQWMSFEIEDHPITGTPSQPEVFEFFFDHHGPSATHDLVVDAVAFAPSFGSELNIVVRHEDGFEFVFDGSDSNPHDLGPADVELGFGDAAGLWSFQGAVDVTGMIQDMHGSWTVSVFDEFDSLPGPEGTLTMSYTVWVPAPAGAGVLLLGAGLAATRRARA